jgi:hypothetical protein
VILLVIVGLAGAAVPAASANPVSPIELDRSSRIDDPQVFVSPIGEQMVSYSRLDQFNRPAMGVRVRSNGGRFGPLDQLSRTQNVEQPTIVFNRAGRAYAIWGVGTSGSVAEQSIRLPRGLFEASRQVERCGRFVAAAVSPAGKLGIACSMERPGDPPDFWGIGFRDEILEAAPSTDVSPYVYDDFIQPKVAWGSDGTFAAATQRSETTTSPPPALESSTVQYRIRNDAAGGEAVGTVLTATQPDYAEFNGLTVDVDGRVIISAGTSTGAQLLTRRPGLASSFASTALAGDSTVPAQVDGRGLIHAMTVEYPLTGGYIIRVFREQPGGAFGQPVVLPTPDDSTYVPFRDCFVVARDGTEFVVMRGSRGVYVTFRPLGSVKFRPPVRIGPRSNGNPTAALVPGGNLLVTWTRETGPDEQSVVVGGWDSGRAPTLSGIRVPRRALVRSPIAFSARAIDPMGVRSVRWTFGDKRATTGPVVSHSYRRPGRYRVRVTATDMAGNRRTATRTVRIFNAG